MPLFDQLWKKDEWGLGCPDDAGLSEEKLARAVGILRDAVQAGRLPGFVVSIGRKGFIATLEAGGYRCLVPDREPMTIDTVFDLASVTKAVATTTAILMLLERGLLLLEDPAKRYIPEFSGGFKDAVTVKHLLTHTSGLPLQPELHHDYPSKEALWEAVLSMPLLFEPGTSFNYTCLGFHILAEIVRAASGASIDRFLQENLFDPLVMLDTGFNPGPELVSRTAATEKCAWRGYVVRGEVHDENCFVLGGVSGNAGLFSTAADLSKFCAMVLQGGYYGNCRILSRPTLDMALSNATCHLSVKRCLGWAIDYPAFGSLMPGNIGHTGFTGCSICLWPKEGLFVVLLTNRVHPNRGNTAINDIRPRFHNAVAASITD